MQNRLILNVIIGASCALFAAGQTNAQDTPAPSTPKASSQSSSAGGSSTGAAKSGQTTGTKTGQGTTAAKKPATPAAPLTTQKQKASYAIGANIGRGLRRDGVDVDPAIIGRGIRDSLAGGKMQLTDDEMKAVLTTLTAEMKKKQDAEVAAIAETNKKEGETFLAANKAKEGVIALPDGLQYRILTPGNGPKPTPTDTVVANYKGTLINGTEFDSSYKRGQPVTFPVGRVIKGWTEVLQLMPVGSKWEVYIPSDLAYGPQGPGNGPIGPNETLVFEIELVSIQPKGATATPPPPPAQKQ
ncbi:MAG TPA: FKBP-type peptidyl-prolyl cis-trans isomerase [Candidatus Eremiobacteraceae bacterium]|jgi:FKBP-type peptidyl-prolyl cis-trans isomerase FklB|nr:FKBP-type peptidyl-prolyl cis-trans isomerase [Candidatus Eremiobacteraceae bacterium]